MSGGGVVLDAKVPVAPGYQVPYAERVRRETGITTGARRPHRRRRSRRRRSSRAARPISSRSRARMLFDPRWPWHAALALGADVKYPPQYARAPEAGRGAELERVSARPRRVRNDAPQRRLQDWTDRALAYVASACTSLRARSQLVRRAAAVDGLQHDRPAPGAMDVLQHARGALEVEAAAVGCVVVHEHERAVGLHLADADARRAVVELRREDRFAHLVHVARSRS